MSEQAFWQKYWKLVLNLVTILALVGLVWGTHKQVADSFANLAHVHGWLLLTLLPIELLNYHAQTKLYQGMFKIVGNDLPYKKLFRASLELNFVNHVFPSGGAAGISYFTLRLRSAEITGAKATLIHVMKLALTFLSFEILILFGMVSLAVMGHVSNITVMVATSISTLLLVCTMLFAYVVGSKQRINSFFGAVTRGLNRLIRLVFRKVDEPINIEKARTVFDEFHENYQVLRKDLRRLNGPFWWGLVCNATEVAAVYMVYVAFGHAVNVGAVIMSYAVANFAGLVSVLPGGVGIYEALMTAVMATAGVSPGITLPVVVMYRVVNTLIQVPVGYVLYHMYLRGGGKPVNE